MPDLYAPNHFDLAGTIVGIVKRDEMLDGSKVREGDILLGLASDGLHTNGYSLARKVFEEEIRTGRLALLKLANGQSVADALMQPHRCYLPALQSLIGNPALHALSHITGSGIEENTRRVIPKDMKLDVNWQSWPRPEIFTMIRERGKVAEDEMRRVFNLGIGVIAILDPSHAREIAADLQKRGERVYQIGRVTK
jgi:phosphoribosylformylglycinamidine cyclo-ligase